MGSNETKSTYSPSGEEESSEGGAPAAASGSGSRLVNVSEWIAHAIADSGTTVVYGGHGGALVPLVNAVVNHPHLTWVYGRNEHDAATMAAAHAKLTGQLGVVIATSGPGATNLTTGLLEAVLDQVPLLAITGLKPRDVMGYSEFQDLNQSRLFAAGGVEWSKDAASPHAVIPLLRDAVATALTKRTAVHLAVPVDVQAAPSPLELRHFCASHAGVRLAPHMVEDAEIRAVAETLVGSEHSPHPRTVVAVGLRAAEYPTSLSSCILNLAEALDAPVLTRLDAKGVVDERHPLSFGVIGVHGKPGLEQAASLISTADRILSVGVQDETLLLCNSAGLQIRKCVEVQPDALAAGTRYNAEHTLLGDLKTILERLTELVEGSAARVEKKRRLRAATTRKADAAAATDGPDQSSSPHGHHRRRSTAVELISYMAYNNPKARRRSSSLQGASELFLPHVEQLGEDAFVKATDCLWTAMHQGNWKALMKYDRLPHAQTHATAPNTVHPATVLEELSKLRFQTKEALWRDAVVAVDVGDVTLWASLCLTLAGGTRTLYSERLGTMGYALNAGIAAILARPPPAGALVLAGDGGFQMTLQELATFQQLKRKGDKLLVIVFDNELLGRVIFGFDDAGGCEVKGPDYVKLAEAYGGRGTRLDQPGDVPRVLREALEADGLSVLHVVVDPLCKADMASFRDKTLAVMSSG